MKLWIAVVMVFASCAPRAGGADGTHSTPAPPPTPSPNATAFQASFDDEAAGKVEAALADLDRLSAPQSSAYLTLLRRAWLLSKLGRGAESADAYAKATALEPASVEARLGALPVFAAARRWADVETVARQVLERDPASYVATLRLAFALYSLGRFPESEVLYRKLSTLYPGDVEVRAGLGWALLQMKRRDDAVKVFADVLDVAPKSALATEGLRVAKGGT
jgi:tetratricopeptide (TPR) repeat protein